MDTLSLLLETIRQLPADAQAQRIAEISRNDPQLAEQLSAKLGYAASQPETPDEQPATVINVKDAIEEYIDIQPGDDIGPYHILKILGEGGMGSVFLAEQREPVNRRVALKLVKLGMDTKEVVHRFESERQALAMMHHQHIAAVLDAGATQLGRPYFVMEYVPGLPITDYCDRNRLGLRERLQLFLQACHAIQHAHQRGILHRDIKPSNVLVMEEDDAPVVKVIDFGVAKATNQRLVQATVFTEVGVMIGTPEYMSPEQADMSVFDVDTRTDVYSLGVLLYELLVGAKPFDSSQLRETGLTELQRIIREVDPPSPSVRLASLKDVDGTLSGLRRMEQPSHYRSLKGELDWIVMKAIEKDRRQRYAAVSGLSDDVERFLSDEPVSVGAPTIGYRARKFVRRHKWGVAMASVLLLSLAIGLSLTTWGMVQARQAQLEAEANQRAAELSAAESEAALEVLEELLSGANDAFAQSQADISLSQLIAQADRRMADGSAFAQTSWATLPTATQEDLTLRLQAVFGKTLGRLGQRDQAIRLLQQAAQRIANTDVARPMTQASVFAALGWQLLMADQHQAAADYMDQALTIYESQLPPTDPRMLALRDNRIEVMRWAGEGEQAIAAWEALVETLRRSGEPARSQLSESLFNLGQAYFESSDDLARAEALILESTSSGIALYGPGYVDLWLNYQLLGDVAAARGDFAQSVRHYDQSLSLIARALGEQHPDYFEAMSHAAYALASIYPERALTLARDSARGFQQQAAPEAGLLADAHASVALAASALGNAVMAREAIADMLIAARQAPTFASEKASYLTWVAELYTGIGDYASARGLLEESQRAEAEGGVWESQLHSQLAQLDRLQGRYKAAAEQAQRALGTARDGFDEAFALDMQAMLELSALTGPAQLDQLQHAGRFVGDDPAFAMRAAILARDQAAAQALLQGAPYTFGGDMESAAFGLSQQLILALWLDVPALASESAQTLLELLQQHPHLERILPSGGVVRFAVRLAQGIPTGDWRQGAESAYTAHIASLGPHHSDALIIARATLLLSDELATNARWLERAYPGTTIE